MFYFFLFLVENFNWFNDPFNQIIFRLNGCYGVWSQWWLIFLGIYISPLFLWFNLLLLRNCINIYSLTCWLFIRIWHYQFFRLTFLLLLLFNFIVSLFILHWFFFSHVFKQFWFLIRLLFFIQINFKCFTFFLFFISWLMFLHWLKCIF
jgi:hypothetical protein